MPFERRWHPGILAGASFWGAMALTCVLALGSGWILASGDWDPADSESVAQKIRTAMVFGLALLTFVLLLIHSRRHAQEPPPMEEPAAGPWWMDPLGTVTADGVFTLDDQMLIRSANKGAEEMFGYSAAELSGQSLFRLIPASTRFSTAELLANTHNRKGIVLDMRGLSRDGAELWVELRLTRFERGSRVMYLAVCREHVAASPHPPEENESLQFDWTSGFMSQIGKEIDGAVTTIRGRSDIILDALPSHDQNRDDVIEIRATGEDLARLSKILEIVGRTPAKPGEEIDIHEWLRAITEDTSEGAGEVRGAKLRLEAPDSIVRVETSYLSVVLARLLKRADNGHQARSEIVIRTAVPPEAPGRKLSLEITRPAPVPNFDQLTYELARGIVGRTGCNLDASQNPDGSLRFNLSIPLARS